jgi:uncharacterized protein
MKRYIYQSLKEWKDSNKRRPVLLRGARQTGKTYIVEQFGKEEFENTIYINFERNPEYKAIFSTFAPIEIIEKIILFTAQKPEPEKTLLFLDEIQECPEAIISLRYFYEEMPGLHIIGAGSLLEFALQSENFKMPVGRIQYLYLYPMNFGEFLDASGESALRKYILNYSNLEKIPEEIHDKLNEYIRKYYIIGGMPAVVEEYVGSRDIIKCQRIQRSIIDTYIDDFVKYSKISSHPHLKKVFNSIPGMTGQKFVYAHVDRGVKSEKIKEALELLETAGILTRVRQTNGSGIPLSSGVHESIFKVIFLDIGLFHAISGVYSETAKEKDFNAIFKGAVAEQFVGQELIAYQSPYTRAEIFYWGRRAKSSTAEIDYLIEKNGQTIPVEVKSGPTGRMKSLHIFIEKHKTNKALKISQSRFQKGNPILTLPFYGIESFIRQKEI